MGDATCSIEGCVKKVQARGWCGMHYRRWRVAGGQTGGRDFRGDRNPRWTGQSATYIGVHRRLRAVRGPASAYECPACGQPASEWAYDHTDPEVRVDDRGCRYSVDLARYLPLCSSCHRQYDTEHAYTLGGVCPRGHDRATYTTVVGKDHRRRCRRCHADRAASLRSQ